MSLINQITYIRFYFLSYNLYLILPRIYTAYLGPIRFTLGNMYFTLVNMDFTLDTMDFTLDNMDFTLDKTAK